MDRRPPETRRDFLGKTLTAAAAATALPTILSAKAFGQGDRVAPSEKITLGVIGIGPRCRDSSRIPPSRRVTGAGHCGSDAALPEPLEQSACRRWGEDCKPLYASGLHISRHVAGDGFRSDWQSGQYVRQLSTNAGTPTANGSTFANPSDTKSTDR
jgi:hypothetical protein